MWPLGVCDLKKRKFGESISKYNTPSRARAKVHSERNLPCMLMTRVWSPSPHMVYQVLPVVIFKNRAKSKIWVQLDMTTKQKFILFIKMVISDWKLRITQAVKIIYFEHKVNVTQRSYTKRMRSQQDLEFIILHGGKKTFLFVLLCGFILV